MELIQWYTLYQTTNHKQTKHANEWREPFSRIILALFVMCIYGSKLIEIEHKSRTPNLMGTEPNDDKNLKKISTCLDPASKELTSGNILDDSGEFLRQLFLGCYLLYSIWRNCICLWVEFVYADTTQPFML